MNRINKNKSIKNKSLNEFVNTSFNASASFQWALFVPDQQRFLRHL